MKSLITICLVGLLLPLGACSTTSDPVSHVQDENGEVRVQVDGATLSNTVHGHFAAGHETVPFSVIERDLGERLSPSVNELDLARDIHDAVNKERERHGLSPYAWADSLSDIASVHSADMAKHGFFAHENLSGNTVNERAIKLGQRCERQIDDRRMAVGFGENLAKQSHFTSVRANFADYDRSEIKRLSFRWLPLQHVVDATVNGWMNSSGHRSNILHDHHQAQGISISRSDDQVMYITQVLC